MAASKHVVTAKEQRVAADFLMEIIAMNIKDIPHEWYQKMEDRYRLEKDPFTLFPCTTKEYLKSKEEYEKQLMLERYGYYES